MAKLFWRKTEKPSDGPPERREPDADDPPAQPGTPAKPTAESRPRGEAEAVPGPSDDRYPVWRIKINHDHHGEGRGEDAPPLAVAGLIGAFDGLGGAGGEPVRFPDGSEHTGAWLGSRFVRRQVSEFYGQYAERKRAAQARDDSDGDGESIPLLDPYSSGLDFTVELREYIKDSLDDYAQKIRSLGSGTRIKSRLIKTLPTTLAIATYDLDQNGFTAVWAGDSRVFYLRPDTGLLQVTTDDLRTNADALKNLTEDSPMSNCVSADSDFVLHERQSDLQPFSVLLAATDGCFGYVQTPLHFEHLLLSSMQAAADWQDWAGRMLAGILRVTGDDSTLSAAVIGWRDFSDCRERFRARAGWCADQVRAYDEVHERVQRLDRDLGQARKELALTTSTMWEEYRRTYEMRAESPTRDVRGRQQAVHSEPGETGADRASGVDRT